MTILSWILNMENRASEVGVGVGPGGTNRPGLGMLLVGVGRVIGLWWLYESIGRLRG